MLKLIPSGSAIASPQVVTKPVPIDPPIVSDYQVSVIATSPDLAPIVWALPLTWKLAGLPRPDIRMNQGVKEWVKYSTAFSNWLYTALSVFVSLTIEDLSIPVPDQFIDDVDVTILTLSREYEQGKTIIKIYY